ncbi:male sterility protein [Hirsutella rhossiliensis]|uniref:Male sterility protein n=1 Tax=Hirsutella rhossiliensis TaxID=111463 RepID=A0A9P8SD65_9HYPO|nr:male sterility protein [Hirsutella rhossiliensis]KAH0958276.1 male sterility protein [Hirsutella rhossiliensis]
MCAYPANSQPRNDKLLVDIIDGVAQTNPDATWLEYPASASDYAAGFNAITYRALANATNGLAWHLHRNISPGTEFQTLAYIGPNDARYAIILYACIKAGFKVLFSSPKNSIFAHVNLFSALNCSTLLTTDPMPTAVESLLSHHSMKVVCLPSLEQLLEKFSEPFPYSKTFAEARNDPFVVLHTSGSTGNPKPIVYTHEFVTRNVNAFQLPTPPGFISVSQLVAGSRFVCLLPLFHMAGFFFTSVVSHFDRSTVILPSPSAPPTSDTLHGVLQHTTAAWAAVSPSTVESLGRNPDLLQVISEKLSRIAFLGGNPSLAMGNEVSRKLNICNLIGSSECGGFAQLIPEDHNGQMELWSYVHIHPQTGPVYQEYSPGLCELTIRRDLPCEPYQPLFTQLHSTEEFRTSDLFTAHPTIPGFWRHTGRVDDIIVFLNGEKTNPISFESHVVGHPDVAGALVFGTNRMEAGLLIEFTATEKNKLLLQKKREAIGMIWPRIEEANSLAPAHARIDDTLICIVSPERPMIRTPKGTIKRQETLRSYDQEIDEVYKEAEAANSLPTDLVIDTSDIHQLQEVIRFVFKNVMKRDAPSDEIDFFSIGMDSLQVIRMVRQLRGAIRNPGIEPAVVYRNASVHALAEELIDNAVTAKEDSVAKNLKKRQEILKQVLQEYKDKIGELASTATKDPVRSLSSTRQHSTILLTGTTGYVGSYVLDQLLKHPSSPKILCMNRSTNALEVQIARNKRRNKALTTKFPPERVKFLAADFAADKTWGLPDETFRELLREVTLVIHNAWPVDFNIPLSAFRPSLDGVVNIVQFCKAAKHSPPLVFVSSISAVMDLQSQVIPETLIESLEVPASCYGESKFVAEHVLFEASQRLGVKAGVVRVGQVSGAAYSPGLWNSRDWLPRLVLSSRYLEAIPNHLGANHNIDWIPIDILANVVIDISMNLLPSVVHALEGHSSASSSSKITPVTPAEWVERLRNSAARLEDHDEDIDSHNPALKLLDFFEQALENGVVDRPVWSTEAAVKMSDSLRGTECIQPEWMERWARSLL